jgi:hypothetical protein
VAGDKRPESMIYSAAGLISIDLSRALVKLSARWRFLEAQCGSAYWDARAGHRGAAYRRLRFFQHMYDLSGWAWQDYAHYRSGTSPPSVAPSYRRPSASSRSAGRIESDFLNATVI